jgi:hypothetical protein
VLKPRPVFSRAEWLLSASELPGRLAVTLLEIAGKMIGVVKSHGLGNVFDRHVRGVQKIGRFIELESHQIMTRCQGAVLLEQAGHVSHTDTTDCSHIAHRFKRRETGVNILLTLLIGPQGLRAVGVSLACNGRLKQDSHMEIVTADLVGMGRFLQTHSQQTLKHGLGLLGFLHTKHTVAAQRTPDKQVSTRLADQRHKDMHQRIPVIGSVVMAGPRFEPGQRAGLQLIRPFVGLQCPLACNGVLHKPIGISCTVDVEIGRTGLVTPAHNGCVENSG